MTVKIHERNNKRNLNENNLLRSFWREQDIWMETGGVRCQRFGRFTTEYRWNHRALSLTLLRLTGFVVAGAAAAAGSSAAATTEVAAEQLTAGAGQQEGHVDKLPRAAKSWKFVFFN